MMAYWRKIYGKICENQELGECSIGANLLFERLLIKTDDAGRYYATPTIINKLIFTARKDIKDRQISVWLTELSNKGLIRLYEVDNKKYLYFHNFNKHQQLRSDVKLKIFFPEPSVTDTERPVTDTHESVILEEKRREENRTEKEVVLDVFNHFILKTKKAFKLSPAAINLIVGRLKEGYTLEQLKTAIDNFVQDDWVDRGKHLDLIYCMGKQRGKPDALEKWLNYKPQPKARQP